ncbi:MAG: LPP20 family lipoprotein [Desulfatitalea sp.]|nr:LPP20 family lipoprotein [Desulfatitalea sp.]NNK02124.1 LPP20 family lipoprotein [Desulfatitalea sp.]
MKKMVPVLFIAVTVVVIGLAGCGRNVKQVANEAMEKEFENAPEWVLSGSPDEAFAAVGSAHIGKGGMQFARTEAMSHGRGELARQVAVKVKGLVNSFSQQIGIGGDQTLDAFSKQVSKLVTDETLSGSRQKDLWISPSSDVYVLMVLDKADVQASVRRQVVHSYQQDSAKWQAFQANNGNEQLDREIKEMFVSP